MADRDPKRPILVWGIYVLHSLFLLFGLLYGLVAIGILSLWEEFNALVARYHPDDHGTTLSWILVCFLGTHYLFFRKPKALLIYSLGAFFYVGPNLARYVRECIYRFCPGSDYLLGVFTGFVFFVSVGVLIYLASRSWHPDSSVDKA